MGSKPDGLYLGAKLDESTGDRTAERLRLPSDNLTTHGMIVGMTGSGKTGLGIVLLEEVLSAGIPALIIDPKGDMGNLLLNFPSFEPGEFEPWVDAGEARRKGMEPAELARDTASRWKKGLEGSGIGPEEMRRVRDGADIRIFTPGSSMGTPLNLVGNLAPPSLDWDADAETLRDEIEGLVSGILVMAGIDADPLTSREHILLSNVVEHAWRAGVLLDLPTLIAQIQKPPLRRLGVFELDTFFPPKDRMKLAMRLNGLVASPSFAEWLRGEPLDIGSLLRAPDGRPRASIVYLPHLSDPERQFVVTLLLSRVVTWMRQQPGTSELRALIYADEVMGFAPPVAEPPTKRPILTLYKQARAHGVGVVMATQNPIDMDYKLMSNAGTWMVGRLQTERDKARIIEGLRSASGDVDVAAWDKRIGDLGKREFVLKSAKRAEPTLFTTRWAMSYLRGPFTRAELLELKTRWSDEEEEQEPAAAEVPSPVPPPATTAPQPPSSIPSSLPPDVTPVAPEVSDKVRVYYLDAGAPWADKAGVDPRGSILEAGLAARVRVTFDDRKGDLRHTEECEVVFFPLGERFEIDTVHAVDYDERDFDEEPPEQPLYRLRGAPLDKATFFTSAGSDLKDHLTRALALELFENAELKLYSRVGESRSKFEARCLDVAEDRADERAEKLRDRYENKLDSAKKRASTAERRMRELEVDVSSRQQQELVAGAGEVLSMFLGGRRRVRSLSGISSRRSQTRRTRERLRSAEEKVEETQAAIEELEAELGEELEEIWSEWKEKAGRIEGFRVGLERTDVEVDELLLFWAPAQK